MVGSASEMGRQKERSWREQVRESGALASGTNHTPVCGHAVGGSERQEARGDYRSLSGRCASADLLVGGRLPDLRVPAT